MKIIEGLQHGSPEWLAWRRQGIGSSDIAAICGVCPYKTALDIYNDKKGLSKDRRNSAMQRGIDYEDEARKVFCMNMPSDFQKGDRVVPRYSPLNIEKDGASKCKASLDGYNPFNHTLLEIKIPNRKVLDMARYGQLPIHYLYQIQWQLFVSGCPKAYYFCYNPDTLESYTVEVYPDEAIIETISSKANEFWGAVLHDLPPPAKRSKKPACERSAAILKTMLECKEDEKNSIGHYKKLLAELMQIEGVEDGIESDSASLSLSERSGYDYKRAAEDAGVDLEKYKKPVTVVWTIRAKT